MATIVQESKSRKQKVNNLRYAEYYNQQPMLDELYARSAKGETFDRLMSLILSKANILRAYRTIKSNKGSRTPGTNGKTIEDIEKLDVDELVSEVNRRLKNYVPGAVRRKEIPKPNGKTRPLGIPCMWDRLIQQCILQILEPICEARFSNNSYGFRPLRSAENAIAAEMRLINLCHLHFVVEVDIKGFFDAVNHAKLMRQLWAMGIRDLRLRQIIRAILKAPIRMPDGKYIHPAKGTPQGGILSPLLANVVLNELDQWVDSQWELNPVTEKYSQRTDKKGGTIKSHGYRAMRNTQLKEMHIVRYADDVRILCATRSQADKVMAAVKQWLAERLKLQASEEKTRVVNIKKKNSEFLGFKIKVRKKAGMEVVKSHMCDRAQKRIAEQMKEQIKAIQHPPKESNQIAEVCKFNAMVRGKHNYYAIATEVSKDFGRIAWRIKQVTRNRLKSAMRTEGKMSSKSQDFKKYGGSKQLLFIGDAYILPLGYIQTKNPMCKKRITNLYTKEGRKEVHDNLAISNVWVMEEMARNPIKGQSVEYNDNRVSLFAAQWGKDAVTGIEFLASDEVHCHHKKPRKNGGSDKYNNLILVRDDTHRLIHATQPETIEQYLKVLNLNSEQKNKLNKLRQMAGCESV